MTATTGRSRCTSTQRGRRAGSPVGPPPEQAIHFEIRVVGGVSASILAQADNYIFQIVDVMRRKTAFYHYTGFGLGISIPKVPGPGSMTKSGLPTKFRTTRHTELHQFNSKASLFSGLGCDVREP